MDSPAGIDTVSFFRYHLTMRNMDWSLAEPVFLRNLMITPVRGPNGNGPAVMAIEDALAAGQATIAEREVPDINTVIVNNQADRSLFMLDGEEITGSLQNRIVASSQLIEAGPPAEVPVLCVEEQRWEGLGGFRTGVCSYPALRSILADRRPSSRQTQQAIWREVQRKLTVTRTSSATSSMHDIYDGLDDELDRYLEGFKSLNHDTLGFVASAGHRLLGADIFLSHGLYCTFERKILRAYALDALEQRVPGQNQDRSASFLTQVQEALAGVRIRGRNRHLRLRTPRIAGQALVSRAGTLHVSAFPRA